MAGYLLVPHGKVDATYNAGFSNRPRACLGFRTPSEVFFEKTPPSDCD